MDTSALSFAFSAVFTPINMLVILGGTILGIFIGAMPGMSSPMGLSIMLPFTFQLHGYAGIMMLLGIFCGSIYGGSISGAVVGYIHLLIPVRWTVQLRGTGVRRYVSGQGCPELQVPGVLCAGLFRH